MYKIDTNPDKELAESIRERVRANGGYCPCSLEKSEDTRCMCKEFRQRDAEGYCHCMLYYKQKIYGGGEE